MTVLKYDDIIKNNVILDTILVFFERVLCKTTLMQSFMASA